MSIEGLKNYLWHPKRIFTGLGARGILNWMPDAHYLKIKYRLETGSRLDLDDPQTFNEKLQWLKLYDRKPLYTTFVDKYAVRQYIADTIGKEYLFPLLGVWDTFEDIEFDTLPNQFVLKCTHDSGGNVICKDKSTLNIKSAQRKLNRSLRRNYFWNGREWPYKGVVPRIIGENFMVDANNEELVDYKFFCFGGNVKIVQVCTERFSVNGLRTTFFDANWARLQLKRKSQVASYEIPKPYHFIEMMNIARALSKGIPFVRIDLYEVNGHIYFGEMTFYPGGGIGDYHPEEWNYTLGGWVALPNTGGKGNTTHENCDLR